MVEVCECGLSAGRCFHCRKILKGGILCNAPIKSKYLEAIANIHHYCSRECLREQFRDTRTTKMAAIKYLTKRLFV
jgi:hypothetical protein